MIQSQRNDLEPWYVRKKKFQNTSTSGKLFKKQSNEEAGKVTQTRHTLWVVFHVIFIVVLLIISGIFIVFFLSLFFYEESLTSRFPIYFSSAIVPFILGVTLIFNLIGIVCAKLSKNNEEINKITLAFRFLRGQVEIEEQRKGIPAPEMALYQFIRQVRSYSMLSLIHISEPTRPY